MWGNTKDEDGWSKAVSVQELAGASCNPLRVTDGKLISIFAFAAGVREGGVELRLKEGREGFSTMCWGRGCESVA